MTLRYFLLSRKMKDLGEDVTQSVILKSLRKAEECDTNWQKAVRERFPKNICIIIFHVAFLLAHDAFFSLNNRTLVFHGNSLLSFFNYGWFFLRIHVLDYIEFDS